MAKCGSVFLCGELSRHPDEKTGVLGEKWETVASETAAAKIELGRREVAFSRGNRSLNKHVEEIILLGEFKIPLLISYHSLCKRLNARTRC